MTLRGVSVDTAVRALLDAAGAVPRERVVLEVPPDGTLSNLVRRRPALASDLAARWDLPNAATSVMDGFALRSADLADADPEGTVLRLQAESAAGHPSATELKPGEAAPISTGAVVPSGADAVVPVEDSRDRTATSVRVMGTTSPGRFIRARGSDVGEGDILIPAGTRVGPGELALLLSAGHASFDVVRPPRVRVICTGDELAHPGDVPEPGRVISTNGPMLSLQIERCGAVATGVDHAVDDLDATVECFERALETADVVISSGGISVGRHDWVLAALERLGAEVLVRKVALRPGRPCTFARLRDRLVLALPGNPASSFVSFELFARPLLAELGGHTAAGPRYETLPLAVEVEALKTRDHWVRARLGSDGARPLATQTSGDLRSIAGVDALVEVPAGRGPLPAGSLVRALRLDLGSDGVFG